MAYERSEREDEDVIFWTLDELKEGLLICLENKTNFERSVEEHKTVLAYVERSRSRGEKGKFQKQLEQQSSELEQIKKDIVRIETELKRRKNQYYTTMLSIYFKNILPLELIINIVDKC